MMPIIAIIGRPNVGKSTLFNRLTERRHALVDSTPGVTRDRIYGEAEWSGRRFRVVDTGGIDLSGSSLSNAIRSQTLTAVDEADLLVCLFDGRDGLTPLDEEIAAIVRKSGKPFVFAANKIDTDRERFARDEFSRLGAGEICCISAEHGRRVDEVLDAVVSALSGVSEVDGRRTTSDKRPSLRIAIIGRPNVGKSSLVNRLCGGPRVVAHELPGTTRDSVDVEVDVGGKKYVIVDTAGIRRKAKTQDRVEKFSVIKALHTMERADVVVMLVDASEGLTHQDRQLANDIATVYKPFIIAANKWDLVPKKKAEEYLSGLSAALRELRRVPIIAISARTGLNCGEVFCSTEKLNMAGNRRIKTPALNRLLQEIQTQHHLPSHRSQPVRLYYATQVGVRPPSFAIFANYPETIPVSYKRYLVKAIEEELRAPGLPIRIMFRKRR